MPNQLSLFANEQLARPCDPDTSKQAGKELVKSGALGRMEEIALSLVKKYPGRTARELDELFNSSERQIGKRLNGLRKKGRVRQAKPRDCNITGRKSMTWEVVNDA